MSPDTALRHLVTAYPELIGCRPSDGYLQQLLIAVRLLEQHAGGIVRINDLDDLLVNNFTSWLRVTGRAPATVAGRRQSILCLWRTAWREGLLEHPPRRIARLRAGRRIPEAWTIDEVRQLVTTALSGKDGTWWGSLVAAAWDTALRLGDLLRLECHQINQDGLCRIRQHKTGDDVIVCLSLYTRSLVDACTAQHGSRLVWPWPYRREAFYRAVTRLVTRSGIRPGTFRWLRRGAITAVEQLGGDGSRLAGHRSRSVTVRYYVDASQFKPVQPPPLQIPCL